MNRFETKFLFRLGDVILHDHVLGADMKHPVLYAFHVYRKVKSMNDIANVDIAIPVGSVLVRGEYNLMLRHYGGHPQTQRAYTVPFRVRLAELFSNVFT
jgi:hypothetical protein